MKRYYKNRNDIIGYIIAFIFTKGAKEEVALTKKEGIVIRLIIVKEILDKKLVMIIVRREK